MRLRDLEVKLLWKYRDADGSHYWDCPDLAQAQGVMFLCPKCFATNGNSNVGTHYVICWFNGRGIPADAYPRPGRWNPAGTSVDDLTFVGPGAYSVWLNGEGGCQWHGFVKNGDAS